MVELLVNVFGLKGQHLEEIFTLKNGLNSNSNYSVFLFLSEFGGKTDRQNKW